MSGATRDHEIDPAVATVDELAASGRCLEAVVALSA